MLVRASCLFLFACTDLSAFADNNGLTGFLVVLTYRGCHGKKFSENDKTLQRISVSRQKMPQAVAQLP